MPGEVSALPTGTAPPLAAAEAPTAVLPTRPPLRRMPLYFVVPVLPVLEPVEPDMSVVLPLPMEPEAAPMEPEALVSALVPDAPMEVPLPVLVEPVLGVVPMEPVPLAVLLLVVSLGEVVVDGIVLEDDVEVPVVDEADSSFLPQALRDRAAIRARAAHCAIGDLIIRNSLRISFRSEKAGSGLRCLRLTLLRLLPHLVVCHCRRL